jgi:hypothetical protein
VPKTPPRARVRSIGRAIEDAEGRLTADLVIKAAKNPRHPLHDVFEWDDSKAGHAWRIEQARSLIARVRLQVSETEIRIAYVRDPAAEPDKQGYRATVNLADDKDQAREVVLAELYRIGACLLRAKQMADSVGIEADIVALSGHTERLIATLERPRKKKKAA